MLRKILAPGGLSYISKGFAWLRFLETIRGDNDSLEGSNLKVEGHDICKVRNGSKWKTGRGGWGTVSLEKDKWFEKKR